MIRFLAGLAGIAIACAPALAHAACASKSTRPVDVVQAQHVAFEAHDLDAFLACYADNVVLTSLSGKAKPTVGLASMRKVYGRSFNRPNAKFRSEYIGEMENGPMVVVFERLISPGHGDLRFVTTFEVRDGKIARVWFLGYE